MKGKEDKKEWRGRARERGEEEERKKDSNRRRERNATVILSLFLGMHNSFYSLQSLHNPVVYPVSFSLHINL